MSEAPVVQPVDVAVSPVSEDVLVSEAPVIEPPVIEPVGVAVSEAPVVQPVDVAMSPVSEDVLVSEAPVIEVANVIAIPVTTEGSESNLFLYQTHDGQYLLSEESFPASVGNLEIVSNPSAPVASEDNAANNTGQFEAAAAELPETSTPDANSNTETKKTFRKRSRHESNWKNNKRKRLRQSGQEYTDSKGTQQRA